MELLPSSSQALPSQMENKNTEIERVVDNDKSYLKKLLEDNSKEIGQISKQIVDENDDEKISTLINKLKPIIKKVEKVTSLLKKLASTQNPPQIKQLK